MSYINIRTGCGRKTSQFSKWNKLKTVRFFCRTPYDSNWGSLGEWFWKLASKFRLHVWNSACVTLPYLLSYTIIIPFIL